MNEATEIANAIYYLAATIKGAVCFLVLTVLLIWIGNILFTRNKD